MKKQEKQTATTGQAAAYAVPAPRDFTPAEFGEMLRQLDAMRAIFAPQEVNLSPAQRKQLIGTAARNYGFAQLAFSSAQEHPEYLPPYIPLDRYTEDMQDFNLKSKLLEELNAFVLEVQDSRLYSSDRVYHDSLGYYNSVKEGAKQHITLAESIYSKLKNYFKHIFSPAPEPTEAKLESDFRAVIHGRKEGEVAVSSHIPVEEHAKITVADTAHKPHTTVVERANDSITQK